MTSRTRAISWSFIVIVALIAGVVMIGQPVGASHGGGDSSMVDPDQDHTEPTWDSVWWGYGPNAHETGAEEAGWAFRSTPNDARGEDFDLEYYQYVAIHAPWGDFSNCAVTDTDAAGIDRGDDNYEGEPYDTGSDEAVVQDIQNSNIKEHYGYFQFAGPDDPGGRGIHLNSTDAFTAALSCFTNPDEEGWYRLSVWFNGTGYDGEYKEWLGFNDWKYFCDNAAERCSDRQQAIETLGPPPSEFDYPTGQRVQNYEPDTPWKHTSGPPDDSGDSQEGSETNETSGEATPTPGGAEGNETTSEETPTPGGAEGNETNETTGEETPTPAEEDGVDTPTPTPADEGDSATPTAAEADDNVTSDDGGGAATEESTPTEQEGADGGAQTPAAEGDGPGLGPIVAIAGLLAAALLLRRKD